MKEYTTSDGETYKYQCGRNGEIEVYDEDMIFVGNYSSLDEFRIEKESEKE